MNSVNIREKKLFKQHLELAEGQMDVMNKPFLEQRSLRKLLMHQTGELLREPSRQNRGGGRARNGFLLTQTFISLWLGV